MFKIKRVTVYRLAAIPDAALRKSLTEYITAIETGPTETWCSCEWRLHPDDMLIRPGHCRECNTKARHDETLDHSWKGIRRRLVSPNLECPAHTKEGLLLGFIKWLER